MVMNVTTYEVLVRPSHMQRRFPKNRGKFWFFQGFSFSSAIRNIWNYWTLNTEGDAADFLSSQDHYVAAGQAYDQPAAKKLDGPSVRSRPAEMSPNTPR